MLQILKKPLFIRVFAFIFIFFLISGVSGSWLISTKKLLFPFYFFIYGSAGKAILFGLVCFLLITKDKITSLQVPQWTKLNLLFLLSSLISLGLFFYFALELLKYQHFMQVPIWSAAAHVCLWLSGIFSVFAVFNWTFLLQMYRQFRKALGVSTMLSILFYLSFSTIFKLWPYLSAIVLWSVSNLLKLTVPHVTVIPPLTIALPQFSVVIGEYCSGIESLFLVSVLYILMGCVEWKSLRKDRYFLFFSPLIVGMFVLNIIRVYGIVQAGIWISPDVAAKLFHTYLGMILFMGYFFLFMKLAMPKLLSSNS